MLIVRSCILGSWVSAQIPTISPIFKSQWWGYNRTDQKNALVEADHMYNYMLQQQKSTNYKGVSRPFDPEYQPL